MRNKVKVLWIIPIVMMLFALGACTTGQTNQLEKPNPVREVTLVTLTYNESALTSGVLKVDLSAQSITLGTNVVKTDESVDGEVTFHSTDPEIASINELGVVLLNKTGETVISASAGDKSHEIVLIVEDSLSTVDTYMINVEGGHAEVGAAAYGSYVRLYADIPEHKTFVKWEFRIDDVITKEIWMNGNVFQMPESNLTVKAIYEDKLYTLNVINGHVLNDSTGITSGEVTTYKFVYDTEIVLEANEEPDGLMFVGWDYQTKKNRRGNLGDKILDPFNMPDETLTVWAVYSEKSSLGMPSEPNSVPYSNVSQGFKIIMDGIPQGESADPDLKGMDGYRFAITSTTPTYPEGDYSQENIHGSNLTNGEKGSYTLKALFKNHHATQSISVEFYATYYGAVTTTGTVVVGPGEVVEKTFLASLGFDRPWMGLVVREPIGIQSGDILHLSMVVQKAPTFPDGDKQLEITGLAKWVHIDNYSAHNWAREKTINNNLGMSMIAAYAENIGENGYIVAPITNLPEYDSESPTTTFYFRVINATDNAATYRYVISSTNDPLSASAVLGVHDFEIDSHGVVVFKIEVPRTINDTQFYFSMVKAVADSGGLYGHNIVSQMAYNNIFNVVE